MKSETPLSKDFPNWQDVFAVHIVNPKEYNERRNTEQFGSPADIAEEEVKMVKNTREAVFLNRDDAYAKQVCDRIGVDVLTYTTS